MRLQATLTLAVLVSVAAVALLLAPGSGEAQAYATFEYGGAIYAVSEAYKAGNWEDSVAWCAALDDGWRLPTLDEAKAMRRDYEGSDPFETESPCVEGVPGELWTLTDCSFGAYEIYPLDTKSYCSVAGYCDCDNAEHVCCIHTTAYEAYHFCPVARCVKKVSDDEPFRPIPPSDYPPSVDHMDHVKPVYPNVSTTVYAAVYPAWEDMLYTWDFGDGAFQRGIDTGAALTDRRHAYSAPGSYRASLTVTTTAGISSDAVDVIVKSCLGDFVIPWGYRDFADVMAWLRYRQARDARADLNEDGVLDKQDMRLMLTAWRTPCPGLGERWQH